MTGITHSRVLGLPAQTDPYMVNGVEVDPSTVIQPSDWDADHTIVGLATTEQVAGITRLLDIGVVTASGLLAGPTILYTPPAGLLVLGFRLSDVTLTAANVSMRVSQAAGQSVEIDYVVPVATDSVSLTGDEVTAAVSINGRPVIGTWEAATTYLDSQTIIANGTGWEAGGNGTSGAIEPDWAANAGASVVDGDVTWFDTNIPTPTTGSVHLYALVATPAAP